MGGRLFWSLGFLAEGLEGPDARRLATSSLEQLFLLRRTTDSYNLVVVGSDLVP